MTVFRRPCLHMEGNHAQMKPTLQFRACYTSMRIRGPTSRSKSAQAQEKTHFRQSQKQTQGSEGQMSSLTHLTFGEHPHANTGSPQGVHRPKMGPDGLRKGPAEPLGRPTPFWAQSGPTFSCSSLVHPLRRSRMVPPRKLRRRSTLRGLYKEEESPPLTHHHHVDLVLHCKGEALPRLVLRVAGA